MTTSARRLRFRLWMKLAAAGALGVVLMHLVQLTLGNAIALRAIATEQARLGRDIARLVAEQAADAVLVNDVVTLDAIARSAVSSGHRGVSYCFIVRGGRVVASSFEGQPPPGLVSLRPPGDRAPVIAVTRTARVLDLSEPILGDLGEVRLGLDMATVARTQRELTVALGLLALAVVGAGVLAALVVGRGMARPIHQMLVVADRFDPSADDDGHLLSPRGSDEIAVLGDRFNQMLQRLRLAHKEEEHARQKHMETERMVALGSLVAGVSHEVNNPLTGLKNCVNRLSRPDLPDAKLQEYLALMEEGLGRIEEVVKGLLDFARPHPPSIQTVATRALAQRAAHLVGAQLRAARITCRILEDEHDARVLADPHKIEQALVNLVLNAAYVTPGGGEIRLRLRVRDGQHGIAVEDDGPGIAPENRERVLDPFFTTKPPGEGTGLGLSVTRTIVDANGGELALEFPEEGGTIATVWLRTSTDPPTAA
jgi:two-component system NtrC family sensor kinase